MTPAGTGVAGLTDNVRQALAELVSAHLVRGGAEVGLSPVEVIEADVIARGRPGIVDVVARVGPRLVHLTLGLREPGDETRFITLDEDPVLGVFEDEDGLAVAVDGLNDSQVVTALVAHVTAEEVDPTRVRQIQHSGEGVTLALEDRLDFTVFTDLVEGPRAGLALLHSTTARHVYGPH